MSDKDKAKGQGAESPTRQPAGPTAPTGVTGATAPKVTTGDFVVDRPSNPGFDVPVVDDDAEETRTSAPRKANFEPVKVKDDQQDPVFVEVPKTPEEVGKEGNALARAGSKSTGGEVAFDPNTGESEGKRIWTTDADMNVNLRQNPLGTPGDFVEVDLNNRVR